MRNGYVVAAPAFPLTARPTSGSATATSCRRTTSTPTASGSPRNAGGQPPQCAKRRPLIDPTRQKEITRHALLAFFDAYLKDDADALRRLDAIGETFAEVTLRQELATP